MVHHGELCYAYVGEILGPHAHVSPCLVAVARVYRELVAEVCPLPLHALPVLVGRRLYLHPRGEGGHIEHPRHAVEHRLHLEDVVTVVPYGLHGHALRPLLEGLAVRAEAEAPRQCHEIGVLPVAPEAAYSPGYRLCLLLQALCLQGVNPCAE